MRNKIWLVVALVLSLAAVSRDATALAAGPANVQEAHLVSAREGWLLAEQRLYWTQDGGASWKTITPNEEGFAIRAVSFLDTRTGWVVLTDTAEPPRYMLARTADAGTTWQTHPLALEESAETAAVYLDWIDAETGWLVLRRATSSNFSVGTLFRTTDGGDTWTRLTMPIGAPVYFQTAEIGWTAGGPAGDEFYRTKDGGKTWQVQTLGSARERRLYLLPRFDNAAEGVAPVIIGDEKDARVQFYRTHDGGESWVPEVSVPLGQELANTARPPIALVNARQGVVVAPHSRRLVRTADNAQLPAPEGITELDMATAEVGWAKQVTSRCAAKSNCVVTTVLLRTENGGQTWKALALPASTTAATTNAAVPRTAPSTLAPSATRATQVMVGQGFDKCEVATLSQLQNWWTNSPYDAVNLYIGGSSRACSNAALSASYLAQMAQQGWRFIPTWVGPQAACTSYSSRMSYDATTAYNQGVAQADAAIQVATNLGLTNASQPGTVIYYNLEYYNYSDTTCRNAVKAFITGWSAELQAQGHVAGAYGAASQVSDWANSPHVPDVVWLAHWLEPYQYRSDATVWDPAYVSNTLWMNHQRIRQYSGGHDENWGGVTLNVDSDVIDGIVATGASADNVSAISIATMDSDSNPQSVFHVGDNIRYSAVISNTSGISQTVALTLSAKAPCGTLENWTGNWTAGPGNSTWSSPRTIPLSACPGYYTYQLDVNWNSVLSWKAMPFAVYLWSYRIGLPFVVK